MPRVTFNSRVPSLTGPLIENLSLHEAVRLGPLAPAGGNGSGDGSGDGAGSGFFPVDKPGGRYVFIVDASKSMNHPYPGPARTRFGRAKYELWQTILRMQPEQRFFILFFNTQPAPMPSAVMRPGGRDGNEDLFRWTADFPATGGTDPQAAVLLALQLQPDVIYLLTDGQFNFRVVHESAKVNTRRVRIDTISLGDDIGSRVLQDLAARNGGTYRHVDEQADRYWDDLPATAPLRNASVPE